MTVKQAIPWGMAAGRALLGPLMVLGARSGWNGVALAGMVVTALVSDIFDGVLARRWGCDTPQVRLFDSMADTCFYGFCGWALWVARPAVWAANEGLFCAVIALEVVRFALDFWKFGKPASYHSYLAKTWGLVLATAVVAAFARADNAWLMTFALGLGVVCLLEGICMSLVLPVWSRDVKTLGVAWRMRRNHFEASVDVVGKNIRFPARMTTKMGAW